MIYLLIYLAGYLYTLKPVFTFLYKDFADFEIDSLDLVFMSIASIVFTLFWPLIWAGIAINKHILKPIVIELEKKNDAR
jgi:hypothetical protein